MQIQTKIIEIERKPTLSVTMKDCEGFNINENMNKGQAEAYLDELNVSVKKTKEFLNKQQVKSIIN